MDRFHTSSPRKDEDRPISIKIRPSGGCFHREHSPIAYQIIDEYLYSHQSSDFVFEEHESGPELLVFLAFATAGMSLTANIINLVTAIIKARSEGIHRGDHRDAPLELIVRGFDEYGNLREEINIQLLRFNRKKVEHPYFITSEKNDLKPGNVLKVDGEWVIIQGEGFQVVKIAPDDTLW